LRIPLAEDTGFVPRTPNPRFKQDGRYPESQKLVTGFENRQEIFQRPFNPRFALVQD
jgi:hypothetical protein